MLPMLLVPLPDVLSRTRGCRGEVVGLWEGSGDCGDRAVELEAWAEVAGVPGVLGVRELHDGEAEREGAAGQAGASVTVALPLVL
ncbi:hypothetical protein HaLaN_16696 [Haematococcus lacustris]|uniref:Uncharacterized protein n=1 Tax=Haematococcus lacustris TaxID=44745 RepID=A0A699ZC64_HAELA|nr:hypothetical protein HaLaN_16696 [Haematococcus lacustris]